MFGAQRTSFVIIIITTTLILKNINNVESREMTPGMFYILQWTKLRREPFVYWKPGQNYFKFMKCEYQNCFITDDVDYLDNVIDFDVILFNAIDTGSDIGDTYLPIERADNQIYVFVTTESAHRFPLDGYNFFFNYTWTYKLNSDIPYPYVSVRNKTSGEVIGPKKDMHWIAVEDMKPVRSSIINKIQTKKFAAAWFVTNCGAKSGRSTYVNNLRTQLSLRNYDLHIYGACGTMHCPKEKTDECFKKIETDYYFYLAFENSLSEDYVTEKVLTALEHYAIPIVFGAANYSRFMPDGIYLNAYNMDVEELAGKMAEILEDHSKYYDFFKWHRYYSFHNSWDSAETDPLCAFCAFLNGNWSQQRRVYASFSKWWNEDEHEIPQTDKNDTIFYFKKPHKLQTPYIHLNPQPSILRNMLNFVDYIFDYIVDSFPIVFL